MMTTLETVTLVTAIVGAATGIGGLVLGIITVCDQLAKNRVRLRVIPKLFWLDNGGYRLTIDRPGSGRTVPGQGHPADGFCIEVINLSASAVTIAEVGTGYVDRDRGIIFEPETDRGGTLPRKLEPRESITCYAAIGLTPSKEFLLTCRAYAQTDCETVKYGTSPIWEALCRGAISIKSRAD